MNSYRDPSPAGLDFAQLLRAVGKRARHPPRRFTTSHPRDFVKDIVDAIDANPALCDHVHLPVQSGSSRVLDRMQRLYTRDEYMRRIEWMKRSHRDIAITTDIIVGFPGETEEDFQATLDLLDEVEYDSVFSFKYSQAAEHAGAAVSKTTFPKKRRRAGWQIVQERQRAIQIRRNAKYVGEVERGARRGLQQGDRPVDRPHVAEQDPQLPSRAATGQRVTARQVPAGAGDTRRPQLAGRRVVVRAVNLK